MENIITFKTKRNYPIAKQAIETKNVNLSLCVN